MQYNIVFLQYVFSTDPVVQELAPQLTVNKSWKEGTTEAQTVVHISNFGYYVAFGPCKTATALEPYLQQLANQLTKSAEVYERVSRALLKQGHTLGAAPVETEKGEVYPFTGPMYRDPDVLAHFPSAYQATPAPSCEKGRTRKMLHFLYLDSKKGVNTPGAACDSTDAAQRIISRLQAKGIACVYDLGRQCIVAIPILKETVNQEYSILESVLGVDIRFYGSRHELASLLL